MNDKLQDKLITVIDQLSQQLGVASSEVYNALTIQAGIEAHFSFIIISFCIGIPLLLLTLALIGNFTDKDDLVIPMTVMFMISIVLCLLVGMSSYKDYITCTKNPKYWAIKEITRSLKD